LDCIKKIVRKCNKCFELIPNIDDMRQLSCSHFYCKNCFDLLGYFNEYACEAENCWEICSIDEVKTYYMKKDQPHSFINTGMNNNNNNNNNKHDLDKNEKLKKHVQTKKRKLNPPENQNQDQ